jgi:hypothetical protein
MFPSVCTYPPARAAPATVASGAENARAGPEVRQPLKAVGLDLDGGEELRQRLEDEGNIPAQEHRRSRRLHPRGELFQQHASVGMY